MLSQGSAAVTLVGAVGSKNTTMRYMPVARFTPRSDNNAIAQQLNEVEATTVMLQAAQQINMLSRKENTAKAYDPKAQEYYDFCNFLYPMLHLSTRFTVTSEKLLRFLSYQAFRNKRKMGGQKKGQYDSFDPKDFTRVSNLYTSSLQSKRDNPNYKIPDPKDPLGFDAINTYCSTVQNIWSEQVDAQENTLAWDLVCNGSVKQIMNMVRNRRSRIKRARYKEKLDTEFAPFQSIDQVDGIENYFWKCGKKSWQ